MKWILLDANNLVHRSARAIYSRMNQVPVDLTVYSVLDSMLNIGQDPLVKSNRYAVFFDSPRDSKRKQIFPQYKQNRSVNIDRAYTSGVRRVFDEVRDLFPRIGFPVYELVGYEADDLIASAANWVSGTLAERAVIISSDSDLWQCINEYVSWYDFTRKRFFDRPSFVVEIGDPAFVANVKAITGCVSDGVPGIYGVGEVTAWKYLRGEDISPSRLRAIKAGDEIVQRNRKLVTLPLSGTPKFELRYPVYDLGACEKAIEPFNGDKDVWCRFLRGRVSADTVQHTRLRKVVV